MALCFAHQIGILKIWELRSIGEVYENRHSSGTFWKHKLL